MKSVRIKLFLLFIIIHSIKVNAQVSADALKSAYLVKIANNFNWKVNTEPIKIGFLSNNRSFYFQFKEYAAEKTIGGRPIKVSLLSYPKALDTYDVLFIGEEKTKNSKNHINAIKSNKTLVFTDLAADIENSMVNFYMSFDNKLKFKINSNLLRRHQFEPSSLMLILGGSDNDILSMFEEKDSSIVFERNRALGLKKENKKQENLLKKIEEKMDTIKSSLKSKNIEIEKKSSKIETINGKLRLQKNYLQNISKKIHSTSGKLEKKEIRIKEQEEKLKQQLEIFENQKKDINTRNQKIKSQDEVLEKQESLLNLKQTYLYYAYIFSLVLLGILVFAIISFLGKQKSSRKLAVQNKKLINTLEELKKTQAKLVQNEKMASLGMVTAGMAHEINNPMTFVYTGIKILKAELNNDKTIISKLLELSPNNPSNNLVFKELLTEYHETRESIDQTVIDIELGAKRVTEIINILQNFSRLNENDVKNIDLNVALKSTLTILGSHARKKQIKINTNIKDTPIIIECFPASINQVMVNLISNAIDACPEKTGEIDINITNEQCLYRLVVKDNGPGISQENLGKIFDPFFTTKSIGKGTGLGLSISYNIIKKHNGNILVENNPKSGACFIIEIPKNIVIRNND